MRALAKIICAVALMCAGVAALPGEVRATTQLGIAQNLASWNPSPNYGQIGTPGWAQPVVCFLHGFWDYKNPGYPFCESNRGPAHYYSYSNGSNAVTFVAGMLSAQVSAGVGQTRYTNARYKPGDYTTSPAGPPGGYSVTTCYQWDENGNCTASETNYYVDCGMYTAPPGGHVSPNENGDYCYYYTPLPDYTFTQSALGSSVSIPSGTSLQLQWSCAPQQQYMYAGQDSGCFFGECATWTAWGPLYYIFQNAPSNNFGGTATLTGTRTVNPTSNTTYSLTCQGTAGSQTLSVPVIVTAVVPTLVPDINPTTVNYNGTSVIKWTASNTSTCALKNGAGTTVATGNPSNSAGYTTPALTSATNDYTIDCGNISTGFTITVNPGTVSLVAENYACLNSPCDSTVRVNTGHGAYLTYTSNNVNTSTCSMRANGTTITSFNGSGSGTNVATPAISSNTVYTFTCTGSTQVSATASVTATAPCAAQGTRPIKGWGWSDKHGWLSLDCQNAYTGMNALYDTTNYGLQLNTDNTITGYAWSPSLGWVKFGGLSSFPVADGVNGTKATNARLVGNTTALEGWARACSGTAPGDCSSMTNNPTGWDGWLSLRGSTYGVSLAPSDYTAASTNWGWATSPWGWVAFNISPPPCENSPDYQCINPTTTQYRLPYCTTTTVACEWGCNGASGQCEAPPEGAQGCISINSASCAAPQSSARMRKGATASIYWNTTDTTSCTVTGSNGETYTGTSGTRTTLPITQTTTFNLNCDGGVVTGQVQAAVLPTFIEI